MKKKEGKKHIIAALFSIPLIGLGQILKGDSKKGLKWILYFYLAFPALLYFLFQVNSYVFLFVFSLAVVTYPIFWIYNILDALNT